MHPLQVRLAAIDTGSRGAQGAVAPPAGWQHTVMRAGDKANVLSFTDSHILVTQEIANCICDPKN